MESIMLLPRVYPEVLTARVEAAKEISDTNTLPKRAGETDKFN